MKILIDALSAREGGGVTYIRHFLPALIKERPDWQYTILLSSEYQGELIDGLHKDFKLIIPSLPPEALLRRWLYLQTFVPRLIRKNGFDLLFTVAETSTLRAPCPSVVLVRNLNFYARSFSYSTMRWRLQFLAYRLTRFPFVYLTLRRANRLVFVSDAFRDQVAQKVKIDLQKTRVVHHGVSSFFFKRNLREARGEIFGGLPYFLSVSNLVPHKNYETLLVAFSEVLKQHSGFELRLAIVGAASDGGYHGTLLELTEKLDILDRVHFFGLIDYYQLPSFYQGAVAFIFPSRLESFGQPLVEAMACSTPVITTDLMVCREICEDAALYFNPDDSEQLARHMVTIVNNPDMVKELIAKGLQRARSFSWEKAARKMIEIFEEVVREDMPYPQSR